jgi:hypothetical protein
MAWPNYSPDDDARPGPGVGTLTNEPNISMSERTKQMRAMPGLPKSRNEPIDTDYEEIELEDGGVIIRLGGPELLTLDGETEGETDEDDVFYANIAEHMNESDLAIIAEDLIQGIEADLQSRKVWMANYERGMSLLGTEIKQPRGDATGEGVSQVDHPVMLETCIMFHSNARAEMLPATGPVKIDNGGRETAITDAQATKLEKAFNKYLTKKRPEYVPDTDRMLFQWGYGGMAFKKVFHCPLRRAPVSDAIEPGDFIISNKATSLTNSGRKTHRTKMRQSVMARMQYVGAYRKVDLQLPTDNISEIERKTASIAGIKPTSDRVEDAEYTIYECCCEIDMPGDLHMEDGQPTGLPRPYIVTIEHDTRTVLEIRRNWRRDDDNFAERRRFVAYQFIPMFGFYATGLLGVLANTTSALTAAWRIMLDSGMFANFPGFLYAKQGDRQMDNNFRVAPGEGAGVDIGGADDIRKSIMNLPYKEFGPAFPAFTQHVSETAARVGGTANTPFAEGKAEAPVGTTLAMLEQAAKMISAVHMRGHQSQSEEFEILLELIREDPKSFVRLFADDEDPWSEQELLEAIDNYKLTPVADPNTPTQMHRLLKVMGLVQMADRAPERYDGRKVDAHALEVMGFDDPEQFFAPPQPPGAMPADPSLAIAEKVAETKIADTAAKKEIAQLNAQVKVLDIKTRKEIADQQAEIKIADIEQRAEDAGADRTQHGALELYKAQGSEEQAERDREHQSMQSDADRQHQSKEGEASRKQATQLAKMKPKPAPGAGKK